MRGKKARILVVTGPGKGKTTSALGMIVRSLAHGRRVLLVRFCKAAPSGELTFFAQMPGIAILNGPTGMTPAPDHPDFPLHRQAAQELFARAREAAGACDLLVLDEVCGAVARNLLAEEEVTAFLQTLRPDQTAVLTGRDALPGLIAAADTVSEILALKHGYQKGIAAEKGVEF